MPSAIYASPAVFGVIAILLGGAMLFSHRISVWSQIAVFCALLCALPMLWQSSLGLPRPTMLDTHDPHGTVVSYVVDEPNSILLWLIPDGSSLPRSYALRFDPKQAMQLQHAFETAKKNGAPVRMGKAGDKAGQGAPGGDGERRSGGLSRGTTGTDDRATEASMFYSDSQPADPLKTATRMSGD
jgi:hypothetical protein